MGGYIVITRVDLRSLLVAALILAGCAATVVRLGQSATSYETVFEAARQAAIEQNFGITAADLNSGLISGQQGVLFGRGNQVFINIKVSKGTPNSVEASVVPPPGVVGNTDGMVQAVFDSIKKRVPDLVVRN